MQEHLVQSHLGGYYISDGDPEFIETYCETCGDYDMILTSWDDGEEKEKLNALLRYFISSRLNTKNDLDNMVAEYASYCDNKKDIIKNIINDIEFYNEETDNIVNCLFEDKSISEEELNRIIQISNFNKERQIKMVKKFAKTYYSKQNDEKPKVMKKIKNNNSFTS